ncbi:hypothetical protein HYX06_02970 [Candidatus Woesearchaeota archaeon]|nr:hypothetical protein [Candidatus Woesearchaeota archaeon]
MNETNPAFNVARTLAISDLELLTEIVGSRDGQTIGGNKARDLMNKGLISPVILGGEGSVRHTGNIDRLPFVTELTGVYCSTQFGCDVAAYYPQIISLSVAQDP